MVLVCDLQPRTLYSAHGNMRLNKVTIIKGNAEMAAGLLSKSLDAGYKHWEHKEFLIFFCSFSSKSDPFSQFKSYEQLSH